MTPTEIQLLKESLDLLNTGIAKLMQIESKNNSIVYLLSFFHSGISFAEKILTTYEKV